MPFKKNGGVINTLDYLLRLESIVRLSLTVYRGQHLAGVEDVVRVQQSLDAPHQPYERLALGHMQELRLHHTWLWLWLGLGLG